MKRLHKKIPVFLIMVLAVCSLVMSGCGGGGGGGGQVAGTGSGVPLGEAPVTVLGNVGDGAAGAPGRLDAPLAGYAVMAKNAVTGVILSGDPAITDASGNFILSFKIPLDQDISIVIVAQDPNDATGATIMRAILPISSADLQTLINQFQGHPVLTVGAISPTSEQLVLAMEVGLGLAPGSLGTIAVFKTATEINDEAANGNKFVINGVGVVVQGTVDDGTAGTDGTISPLGDFFGPPPADDPSAFTGPFIGLEFAVDLLATLPPQNEGAFEGGDTGTPEDAGVNNTVPEDQQDGGSNVPTNSKPSPLFGAQPFVQQMLVFEEFGPERLDPNGPVPANAFPVSTTGPAPQQDPVDILKSAPDPVALEAFLAQAGIAPFPTQFSNTVDQNPWKLQIENYLGRLLDTPPAEGRPPGQGWADKAWDQEGQLWFNIVNNDGFLGDQVTANWLWKPYFDVRARSYRFRILNGAVSRFFAIALVHQVNGETTGEFTGPAGSGVSYNRVPFHMIANDGNVMEHAVPFDGTMDLSGRGNPDEHKGKLPTQMIAERYDIIVNFSQHGIQPDDKLYFVNVLEHVDGKGTNGKIPLADILSEAYKAELQDDDGDGVPDRWINGDPAVGKFLEFRVKALLPGQQDLSMNPADFIPGKQKMIPLTIHRDDPADQAILANARHRTFSFTRGGPVAPWAIATDGGPSLNMDPRRISAAPQLSTGPTEAGFAGDGTLEVWSIEGNGGWDHPVHIHFEEGIILSQNGGEPPTEWEKWTRKDMYGIGPDEDNVRSYEIAIWTRDFAGTYVEHCHNTMHEDHAMLLRWDIEHPGQVELMPTPIPTWDGVFFENSAGLPTIRTGDAIGPQDPFPLS